MVIKWNTETEQQLLVAVVAEGDSKLTNELWNQVAQRLGQGLTGGAVSQKFYKLKKEAEKLLSDDTDDTPAAAKASKSKTPSKSATKSSGGNKRKKTVDDAEANDAEAAIATPSKKPRAKKIAVKIAKIKQESESESESVDPVKIESAIKTETADAKGDGACTVGDNKAFNGNDADANSVANCDGINEEDADAVEKD